VPRRDVRDASVLGMGPRCWTLLQFWSNKEITMMRPLLTATFAAVILAVLVPAGVLAIHSHESELEIERPGESVVLGWRVLRDAERSLEAFTQQTDGRWGVTEWNHATGTPHLVYGSGVQVVTEPVLDELAAVDAARTFIDRYADFTRSSGAELRVYDVVKHRNKWAVNFAQYHDGMRVVGGRADVVLTDSGRVFFFGSDIYPDISLDSRPALSASAGFERAVSAVGLSSESATQQELETVILPEHRQSGNVYRAAHRVMHYHDSVPARWESYVDASTGDVLWRLDRLFAVDFSGNVDAEIEDQSWCDGVSMRDLMDHDVVITDVGSAVTGVDGTFTLPYEGTDDHEIIYELKGPWADVYNFNGPDAYVSDTITPGVHKTHTWLDVNCDIAERDAFYFTNRVHDFITTVDPDLDYGGWPNNQMDVNVNRSDGYCPGNAWYSGTSINFCLAGGSYANTARIGDVVYHEYGHGCVDWTWGGSGPPSDLHEGNSDIIANLITKYSIIGYGFYASHCAYGIRNSDNNLRYPEDLNGSGHHDGQIIAGFIWDSRENLIASLGEAVAEPLIAEIWQFGRKMGKPMTQPDQVYWTFVADDDDGDLTNGTAHYMDLCDAADHHGFDCLPLTPGVHFSHSELWEQTPTRDAYEVTATAWSTEGNVIPGSVVMHWRVNGGGWMDVPMTPTGDPDEFTANIPEQSLGEYIEYYLEGEDDLGYGGTGPEGAPANLWDFQIVTYYDALEAESGWVIGADDDDAVRGVWERVDPTGTAAAPSDDSTPFPGTHCFITDQHDGDEGGWQGESDIDGGKTTLFSPVYDVTGSATIATLKYRRWYSTDTGNNGGEDPWVVSISNDAGDTWVEIENTTASDRSWLVVEVDLFTHFPEPESLQVMFEASDYGTNAIVEAGVDDLSIIADLGQGPVSVEPAGAGIPAAAYLAGASPNPFNPRTTIHYGLTETGSVRLEIYDISGRKIRGLVDTVQRAGHHAIAWDGLDSTGNAVASGAYFYRLTLPGFTKTAQMTLLR